MILVTTFTLSQATNDVREALALTGIQNPNRHTILDMYCEAYKHAWNEGLRLEPYTESQALEAFAAATSNI